MGDGSSQRPRPTSWGAGESCLGGIRCLWRACGRRQFPMARAHQLGGQGVVPRGRSVPMEGLRGTTVPNGPGPPAGGLSSTPVSTRLWSVLLDHLLVVSPSASEAISGKQAEQAKNWASQSGGLVANLGMELEANRRQASLWSCSPVVRNVMQFYMSFLEAHC